MPVPPALVAILRAHIERFGVAKDGRLFQASGANWLRPRRTPASGMKRVYWR